eukprot:3612876-Pleurochrysis_carterae.AAC.2
MPWQRGLLELEADAEEIGAAALASLGSYLASAARGAMVRHSSSSAQHDGHSSSREIAAVARTPDLYRRTLI